MRTLFFFILSIFFVRNTVFSTPSNTIYLHANVGSFCHRAMNKLIGKETLFDERIFFCDTAEDALYNAYTHNGYAFIKLYEDPDRTIDYASAKALQSFQIESIASVLRLQNKIHIYKHKQARSSITKIASDPHLLKKIQKYIHKRKLGLIEVPGGSDEAAQLLSSKEFDLFTGVAGCSLIGKVFPDLVFHEKNIQDYRNNYNIYALIKVSKRDVKIGLDDAEQEVLSLTAELEMPSRDHPQTLIFAKDLFFQAQTLDPSLEEPLLPQ